MRHLKRQRSTSRQTVNVGGIVHLDYWRVKPAMVIRRYWPHRSMSGTA